MDINEKISNLLTVTQRLVSILERENAALAQYKPGMIAPTVEEKGKLSKAYELLSKSLIQDGEAIKEVDEARRLRLGELVAKLDTLADENSRRLRIAIEASQRALSAVAKAAKENMTQQTGYGRNGTLGTASQQGAPNASPLSFNQVL